MIRRCFLDRSRSTRCWCGAVVAAALLTVTVPRQSVGQQFARPTLSLELKAALAKARERTKSANAAASSVKPSSGVINANALNLPTSLILGRSRASGSGGGAAVARIAQDASFERIVDFNALGSAWDALDAAGVADGALALMEGERMLGRPHASLRASDVAAVAARLAVENGDAATLSRLEKAASRSGDTKLAATVSSMKMLDGKARSAHAAATIDIGGVTPGQYEYCVAVSRAATRARVTGNAEYILPLVDAADSIVLAPGLPPAAEAALGEKIATVCGSLPQTPEATAGGLDILAAASRDWNKKVKEMLAERQKRIEEERNTWSGRLNEQLRMRAKEGYQKKREEQGPRNGGGGIRG
jgi:hypothetical protein